MKVIYSFIAIGLLLPLVKSSGDVIKDPIADFLILPIKDRYTDVSEVVDVHEVKVDIDNDGVEEQFIGHNMMWWGDNHGWYGAFYKLKPTANDFLRLTSDDEAIGIDPRFFGPRETSFVGYIGEQKNQGLLVLGNDFVIRDPSDPGKLAQPEQYSTRKFYHIQNGRLIVDDLGPLDLRTPEGKAFFDRYFGKGVKSRPIRFEDYPLNKLKELGYSVPDWKHPLESLVVQATPQSDTAPIVTHSTPAPIQKSSPTPPEAKQSPASFPIITVVILVAVISGAIVFFLRRKGA